jgi:DNA topoisomerase IB
VFEFVGKSGKKHKTGFRDRRLARIVAACQELRGQRLFQYIDEDGQRRAIEAATSTTTSAPPAATTSRPRTSAPGTARWRRWRPSA